jgi:hypothetical protein
MKATKFRVHVDSVIMTVAGITLAISVFFLLHDGLFQDYDTTDLKAVGTFKLSRNDVRRRVDSGMTWSSVEEKQTVYEGDSIFTGDKSEASIQLENGTVIKVDPKSLVVIRTNSGRTEIDLMYGSLQGKIATAEPIVIKENGVEQKINTSAGAQLRIVKQEKQKTVRVQVTKGELKVENDTVKEDEVIQLFDKKTVIQKSTVTLVSPSNGDTKWLPLGSSLNFKWKASGAAAGKPARIEFARESHFEKTFYAADASGDRFNVSESNLPEGSFYWRVKPQDGDASLPALVTAYADAPPMPVLPKDAQVYPLDSEHDQSSKTVFFTWEDKAGSVDYELQVARDAEFKNIVKSKLGKEKVERVADLPVGTYYWHVKGRHPDRENAPYSRLMTFSIKDGAKVPTTPQLTKSELNYTIPDQVLSRFPASAAKAGRGVKPVNLEPFAWSPVENAQSYEVEVAVNENFSNAVRSDNGASTQFQPKEVRPGALFMRVRARGADGRIGQPSKTARLNVLIPPPNMQRLKPVVETFKSDHDLKTAAHGFNLQWKPQSFAEAYELQWGADAQFTKSKTFKVKETSRLLKVTKPDSYAARVRALDADGTPISAYSSVETASYRKTLFVPPVVQKPVVKAEPRIPASVQGGNLISSLPLPQLREPASASALVSLEDAPTFVTFKWKPLKGATSYTIQISSDADFTKVVKEQKVDSTSYLFQKGLPEGKVFWRVRANTKGGFSNWSDPNDINVIYQ